MFDLYKRLHFNDVTMTVCPANVANTMMDVKFERNGKVMFRSINLLKINYLEWSRDHILIHILNGYLNEFLDRCREESMKEMAELATDGGEVDE